VTTARRIGAAVALAAAALGAACRARPEQVARRYALHGTIVAVNRSSGNVVVAHDDIPGYMSAMTMPYAAGRAENITFLENGDEIRADLLVTIEGAAHLEHITVVRRAKR
jgi:Cu/Ag efflux protein CusF